MPFKKKLNKYLKNTAYKHSPANKPAKNSYYILYNFTLAPARRNNNFKPIIILKIIKNI